MAKFQIVLPDDLPFVDAIVAGRESGEVPPDVLDRLERTSTGAGSGVDVRQQVPGGPEELQMVEVRLAPNREIAAHAHLEDEVIYVVEGEIRFGRRRCPAGSTVVVPKLQLYGFRAGPDGCRFLNFRSHADSGSMTKEQLMAHRTTTKAGATP